MLVRLIVYLALISHVGAPAAAQAPSSSTQESEQARYVIREALSAREAVRTGHVQITGHIRYRVFEGEGSFEGPIRGLYVFDRVANLYRYDGERPSNARVNLPGDYSIRPPDASTPVYQEKYGFLRAAEYFANWGQHAPQVVSDISLRPLSEESANDQLGGGYTLRDVMAFGMYEHHHLGEGTGTAEMYELMLGLDSASLISQNDQTVTVEVGRNDWFCRIEFNRTLAAPVQLEERNSDEGVVFKSDTEWHAISGVAVPVKYSTWYTVPGAAVLTMELDLEWLSVNEQISESEFKYTAFTGVPTHRLITVIDVRGDEPVYLGRWIGDGGVLDALGPKEAPTPRRKPGPPLAPVAAEGSRLWVLYVINGLFLSLLIAVWWWKRKPKPASEK
jgi:hypothetical protein